MKEDENYCVYLAKSPSNKTYIGVTKDLGRRIKAHYYEARRSTNPEYNCAFKKAIRKYWKDISFEKLEGNLAREEALKLETYYIGFYNSFRKGYNMTLGGDGRRSTFYTKEELLNIASQYNTLKQWRETDRRMLDIARKKGESFYKECQSHMTKPVRSDKFKEEDILKIINGFRSLKEWRKNHRSSYQLAKKFGQDFLSKCILQIGGEN